MLCLYQVAQEPLFVWTDLSEQDLQSLWRCGLESPNSAAILQKAATQSQTRTELQQQTELELYKQTLRQGKVFPKECVLGDVWMRFVLIGNRLAGHVLSRQAAVGSFFASQECAQ